MERTNPARTNHLRDDRYPNCKLTGGGVPKRPNGRASKAREPARAPRVQIPPPPRLLERRPIDVGPGHGQIEDYAEDHRDEQGARGDRTEGQPTVLLQLRKVVADR